MTMQQKALWLFGGILALLAVASLIGCFATKGFESHLINPCYPAIYL